MTVEEATTGSSELPQATSALVIGGGVAGMQAALDIANQGYKVYLVEKSPSIGGHMAALDKTFPTLDCSACILTPRLSEVARHPNIELMTYSEVKRVAGRAGKFKVEVVRKARYVDEGACSGCGECEKVCPVEVPSEFDEGLGFRKAICMPFPQATPHVYTIDKRDHAACRLACPAGVNTQGFIRLLSQGKFDRALELVRDAIPFPGTLGRVCVRWCEGQCARGNYDESVSIRNLHRFLADYEREHGTAKPVEANITKGERVAVIGAGPAGISCAYHLARMGYPVTVFEKRSEPGGLMRYAIPEYRLPRDILREEIDRVAAMGVEFVFDTEVESLQSLKDQGFKAIFVSTGASQSRKLGLEGEDAKGVYHAIDFLDAVARGEKVKVGERVAVVGGGDAAIDSARVALRLGAKEVTLIYRRSHVELPAIPSEVEDARREGVRFMMLTQPVKLLTQKGMLKGLQCIRMRLGAKDLSSRRRPVPIPDSEFTVAADTLIVAIGQHVAPSKLLEDLERTEWGTIQVDPATLQTSDPCVFAGGDVVLGPSTAVKAVGHGKEAAISIDRYLRGEDIAKGRNGNHYKVAEPEVDEATFVPQPRTKMPKASIASRKNSFEEVELGFSEEEAINEAGRCLGCTVCCECMQCVEVCDRKAIDHSMQDEIVELDVGAIVVATGYKIFDVSRYGRLGYGHYPNVINALEYERLINAAGPTKGHLIRPSDGREPKRIAFIQCVGARDTQKGVPECSRICCMYGVKNAVMAREHDEEAEVTIYYADIRAFGKGFEEFFQMAKTRFGVKFVRGRVGEVWENPETHNLYLTVEDTEHHEPMIVEHDLVVLSPGVLPSPDTAALAEELGVELAEDGFIAIKDEITAPVDTVIPGIFACGCVSGPKDIPDSVTAGSAAAMRASIVLSSVTTGEGESLLEVRRQEKPQLM
ncbi:MAG: FAD-dependent oxidoreductase [Candidatus Thorarchaeota archaeon]